MRRFGRETNRDEFGIARHSFERAPLHWHGFYEIELCISGEGEQYINGVLRKLEPGVITLLTPKDFHRIESSMGSMEMLNVFFYSHVLPSNAISLITESDPPFCSRLANEEFQMMRHRIETLWHEKGMTDVFHERSVKCRIESICIDIIRSALAERQGEANSIMKVKENRIFERIIRDAIPYINENFAEGISRDEMARRLHLNPSYFSEIFKRGLGISYSDYVASVRMAEAMRLLKYTDKSVNEIMEDIGYRSPTAFYRKFKECYDMLPGDVRKSGYERAAAFSADQKAKN